MAHTMSSLEVTEQRRAWEQANTTKHGAEKAYEANPSPENEQAYRAACKADATAYEHLQLARVGLKPE